MSSNLKKIDLRIIKELLIDGRQSFAKIGRKYNIRKETIRNHYEALKKKGIIVGSSIRNSNLIYDRKLMVYFIVKTQPRKLEFVTENILKLPLVVFLTPFELKQTILIFTRLTDYTELNRIKNQLKALKFVENVYTEILTAMRTMPYNLSIFEEIRKNGNDEPSYHIRKGKIKIDKVDKQIIEKLAINGRTSFSEIAKEIDKSIDVVIKRYKKLIDKQIIQAVVQINPLKLGYCSFAILSLSFSKDELKKSVDYLKKVRNVNAIIQTTGRYDLHLILMIKDINEFLKEQQQIMKTPGLIRAECDITEMFDVWPPREIYFNSGAL